MKSKKSVLIFFIFAALSLIARAGVYSFVVSDQEGNKQLYRGPLTVVIWDKAMFVNITLNTAAGKLVTAGYHYPLSGPYTMIVYSGRNEVWRGQVNNSDGQGSEDQGGRIIQLNR